VDLRAKRAANKRIVGNLALISGFLVSVMSLLPDTGQAGPHILAGFLVATGIGPRIEAAISGAPGMSVGHPGRIIGFS
jgi:hypothetical protein